MTPNEKGPSAARNDARPGKLVSGGESTAPPTESQIPWICFRVGRLKVVKAGLGVRLSIGPDSIRAERRELEDLLRACRLLLGDEVRP